MIDEIQNSSENIYEENSKAKDNFMKSIRELIKNEQYDQVNLYFSY
jgi:hypothetical protein